MGYKQEDVEVKRTVTSGGGGWCSPRVMAGVVPGAWGGGGVELRRGRRRGRADEWDEQGGGAGGWACAQPFVMSEPDEDPGRRLIDVAGGSVVAGEGRRGPGTRRLAVTSEPAAWPRRVAPPTSASP